MKKILGAIALFSIAYSLGKYSAHANLQLMAGTMAGTIEGEAKYRIEYTGKAGEKLRGNYAIQETTTDINQMAATLKKPTQVEKVEGILPKTISFKAPKQAVLVASGYSYPNPTTVKIYRNGVECGRPTMVGSAATAGNKICDP
jgi:hypothetical protein